MSTTAHFFHPGSTDSPVLKAFAKYSNASFISIDHAGCVTSFGGEEIVVDHLLPHLALGLVIEDVFPGHPEHTELYRRALRGETATVLFSVGPRQLEVHIKSLTNAHGEIDGAIGFGTDVTERENSRKLRLRHEAELENLFQNTEDGIFLLDRQFTIQRANSIATTCHAPNGPLIDRVCYQRIFGRDKPCNFCPVIETFQTGKPAQSTYFEPAVGKHLQLRSAPIFDPQSGQLVGAFETFHDISDSVRFAEAVKSHEIRTPLNGVIGLSDLLLKTKLNEKQNEYAQLINASGNSLLFLINGIYSVERQRKLDSGILDPCVLDSGKPEKRKMRGHPLSVVVPVDSHSRLAGKVHVLVVEDNRVNQIVARNLLEEFGFTCDVAENGHEACVAVRKTYYDIVLMDCQMPEMDGYEATDLIRKWEEEQGRKHIPIIALTANATKEDVQKYLDAGMDAYCSKPINPQTVQGMV